MARGTRDAVDDVLLAALRMAMAVSVRAADHIGDVSAVQLRALTVLKDSSGGNLNELAQQLGVTVSTTSRLVDRLVAAGFVDRQPSAQTRREVSLTLTPAGMRKLRRYDRLRLAGSRECLERLAADEQDAVLAALGRLVDITLPRADASPDAGALAEAGPGGDAT